MTRDHAHRRPRRPRDPISAAYEVFQEVIGEKPRSTPPSPDSTPPQAPRPPKQ